MALWREKNLDDMYRMLMHEDLASVELQVRGWKALSELFSEQHERLKTYKTALQAKWTSPGGEAYLGKLDQVMTSLQDSITSFDYNAFKLEAARAAISGAQGTLEVLIQQFEDGALTDAWNEFRADEYDKRHSSGPLGIEGLSDLGEDPKPPKRDDVLESSGYNTRGKEVMDRLAEEVDQFYQDFKYPESYQGPKDAVKSQRMGMPALPGMGTPQVPGMPGMPGTPGVPTVSVAPPLSPEFQQTVVTPPATPTVPATPPATPTVPRLPTTPQVPGTPVVPPVAAPATPVAPGTPRSPVRPAATGRPVAPSAPAAPGDAPASPGKPGVSGKMAPPPSAMNPKTSKRGGVPGRPTRPGAPIGGKPATPGKPGVPGKMAPPPSAMNPKTSKRGGVPGRPNQPGTPPDSTAGKPGTSQGRMAPPPTGAGSKGNRKPTQPETPGVGGKPGARKPGRPATGTGSGGRFQAPPHIGAPRGNDKQPRQRGYGKFGPPEGTPGLAGPRVAKPGGGRPVLTNRNAVPPPGSLRPPGLGVPSSLTPPAKQPKVKADNRGVILPSDRDPAAEISPLKRDANRQEERLKNPLTRRYMEEFYQVAGLPPLTPLAPPAPPRQHAPGPAIGF